MWGVNIVNWKLLPFKENTTIDWKYWLKKITTFTIAAFFIKRLTNLFDGKDSGPKIFYMENAENPSR